MIKSILGEITNFYSKDFLFASFLPTLIFLLAIALSLGGVVGFDSLEEYFSSLKDKTQLALGSISIIAVIGIAYLINGMRAWFLMLWSGQLGWWVQFYFKPGEWLFTRRFDALKAQVDSQFQSFLDWNKTSSDFENKLASIPTGNGSCPNNRDLVTSITQLNTDSPQSDVTHVLEKVAVALAQNTVDSTHSLRAKMQHYLRMRAEKESRTYFEQRSDLDRSYGDRFSIRPTVLGNAVESYNAYAKTRYGIEGEVFWPHLEEVLPQPFRERIMETRILLDFFLSMATLAMLYFLLALTVGPLILADAWLWTPLAVAAIVIGYFVYYRMAFFMALRYGDLIRTAFDLYRLDILSKFGVKRPTNREEELKIWDNLSALLVYGQREQQFDIAPKI